MQPEEINPPAIRYIKLGPGNAWAAHALENNLLELGHLAVSDELARSGDRGAVKAALEAAGLNSATAFTAEIDEFHNLPEGSLWITFVDGRMRWALAGADFEYLGESIDHGVRARSLLRGWNDKDISGNALTLDRLSGGLTRLSRYQQSICNVKAASHALRVINARPSPWLSTANDCREKLVDAMMPMIRDLDPSDFELLVDLILARHGWNRLGKVGGDQADSDIIAVQPITGERAFVQVKSEATPDVLRDYIRRYRRQTGFSLMIFAVHTPIGDWRTVDEPGILVWRDKRLAGLALSAGLFDWIAAKCR